MIVHDDLCEALWSVPLSCWKVEDCFGGHPELILDSHVIAIRGDSLVSINGAEVDVYGLHGLREAIIERWLENCLPELAERAKRACLGG